MASILIIDNDQMFCNMLTCTMQHHGHQTTFALTLKNGIKKAVSKEFDIVLLNVHLPDGNGIQAIPKLKKLPYSPEIIIITDSGQPDGAALAIKGGAWDYIEKSSSLEGISLPLIRAIQYRKEKLEREIPKALKTADIIGRSRQIQACFDLVSQASNSDVNVFIQGETGTGKELIARAIHKNSKRAENPFVVVDCGAIPESLVEGLLFGHEKGIYTGADKKQIGLIEQANTGTLFLDEIGELPLSIQTTFLRVIQERQYRPLGGQREKKSDFRLICATNRDLEQMMLQKNFREDLYYRIHSFSIIAPPLRERSEDIRDLATYYVRKRANISGIPEKGFSPEFFESISAHYWPGNVRELFNAIDSAMAAAGDLPILYPQHLPVTIRIQIAKASVEKNDIPQFNSANISSTIMDGQESIKTYQEFKAELQETWDRLYFLKIGALSQGNVKKACQLSGLSKSRLYYFLQKYKISLSNFK